MGVKGLWRLLLPIGRRVSLETLEGQILAIDASIWMTQFLKALRDPDTGRVQAAAHLMGFFRRICKLRFHNIKPVFVFDGATPEIKKREVAARRRRREQFATVSQSAMQRLAQRLLLQNLQKTKVGKLKAAQGATADVATRTSAFEAGFNPGDQQSKEQDNDDDKKPPAREVVGRAAAAKALEESEDEDDGVIEAWTVEPDNETTADRVSDWDQPIQSLNESNENHEEINSEQGGFWNGSDAQTGNATDGFEISNIQALPANMRKDAIEEAKKQQRLQSRKEFMPAAANPLQFSQVQVTNFLRSSQLNKSIARMAVQAAEAQDREGGQGTASDRRARVVLIREKDPSPSSDSDTAARPKPTAALKRQRQHRREDESSDEDAWEEDNLESKAASRFSPRKLNRKAIVDDDEDEDLPAMDDESGDGRVHQDLVVLNSDSENDEASRSVIVTEVVQKHRQQKMNPRTIEICDADEDDDESEAGGFLPSGHAVAKAPFRAPETTLRDENVDTEAHAVHRQMTNGRTRDAIYAQELEDKALAQALQDAEDADIMVGAEVADEHHSHFRKQSPADAVRCGNDVAHDRAVAFALQASQGVDAIRGDEVGRHRTDRSLQDQCVAVAEEVHSDDTDDEDGIAWEDGEGDAIGVSNASPARRAEENPAHNASVGASSPPDVPGAHGRAFLQTLQASKDVSALPSSDQAALRFASREHSNLSKPLDVSVDTGSSKVVDVTSIDDESDASEEGRMAWEDGEDAEIAYNRNLGDGDWTESAAQGTEGIAGMSAEATAALERAEETAANLANWAGRMFRRAVKEVNGSDVPKAADDNLVIKSTESNGNSVQTTDKETPSKQRVDTPSVPVVNTMASRRSARESADETHSTAPISDNRSLQDIEAAIEENEAQWAAERNRRERDADTVTDEMREEAIQLLQLFGVPYMEAPAEAEAQCATLESLGLVDGIVTEDSDVFVFGGRTVYKNIFEERKYAEVYKAADALREMSLGRNQMVALAMMLGGDYSEGIKGVGIVNGLEILQAFDVSHDLKGGLQQFRKWLDGFSPYEQGVADEETSTKMKLFHTKHSSAHTRWIAPDNFPAEDVMQAYLAPVVDTSEERFSWGAPDVEKLLIFCNKNMGWRAADTKALLDPVTTRLSGGLRQTRIDSFMKYEDSIKFAKVRSKRLREVLGLKQEEPEIEHSKGTKQQKKLLI